MTVARDWLDYARHVTGDRRHLNALYAAMKGGANPCVLKLSERDTRALAATCEAAGRTRTAAALREALEAALAPPPPEPTPAEHLERLAAEGALDPDELAALRRVIGGKGGLF